ncbi:MAG: condensation domain-containing protein, partial [Isosphaeraceae bacterium]|nr:condensation domain-containing protein [Isosphaeraceae bacterium]
MSRRRPRVTNLAPNQRLLLAAWKGNSGVGKERIPRSPRNGPVPLSFAQERLWFLEQFLPGVPLYHIPTAIPIRGRVDPAAAESAWNEVRRRHETLRTSFDDRDGQPFQVIAPHSPVTVPIDDLRRIDPEAAEVVFRQTVEAVGNDLFDLRHGPLSRARLVLVADDHAVLLATFHHIVADGWSMAVFRREFDALYHAFAYGQPMPFPDPPLQYADFTAWQRSRLQGEYLDTLTRYWKLALADIPTVTPLPTDFPRTGAPRIEGASRGFFLPQPTVARLNALATAEGATLFMVLLAAFDVLLYRYTNQEDVVIGTPIANRTRAELEGLIGFFANTLVLRTRVDGSSRFRDLLGVVRRTTLDAYAHQDMPFERLVEELEPERRLGQNPLFQVMFAFQNLPERPGRYGSEADLEPAEAVACLSKFDLSVFLAPADGGLFGAVEYRTDLFRHDTMTRLIGHYGQLLEAITADADQKVGELTLLPAEEHRQVSAAWATGDPVPRYVPPFRRIEKVAREHPDAIALEQADRRVTYAELMAASTRVASALRQRGVPSEACVGVVLPRGIDAVVGFLAVLQANCTYVPLDPDYPVARLRLMADSAQVAAVITTNGLLNNEVTGPAELLCLDELSDPVGSMASAAAEPPAEQLAYVIFTSGSTGQPKAVGLPHRVVHGLLTWQLGQSSAKVGTRTLQFAPLSFDVSVQETLATLASGGTLVLLTDADRRDPALVLRILSEHRVERLFVPPLMLRELARAGASSDLRLALREIITAGEALQLGSETVTWLEQLPGCRLVNQYGPSETHVATSYPLTGPPGLWPSGPAWGRGGGGARGVG